MLRYPGVFETTRVNRELAANLPEAHYSPYARTALLDELNWLLFMDVLRVPEA